MFSPSMLEAAQRMMSSMTPEQLAQLTSSIDPSLLPPGVPKPSAQQMREASEKIKSMSSADLNAAVSEAAKVMPGLASGSGGLETPTTLKDSGNVLFKAGNYPEALTQYNKALSHALCSSEMRLQLFSNIAFCHVKLSQWPQALKAANAVLAEDSVNLKALFRRGLALRMLGKRNKAIETLTKAAQVAPDDEAVRKELLDAQAMDEQESEEEVTEEVIAHVAPSEVMAGMDAKSLASMASIVESLPEEFFEQMIKTQAGTDAAPISGRRMKCMARLMMKTLKVWMVITDVGKTIVHTRAVVAGLGAVLVGLLAKMYLVE